MNMDNQGFSTLLIDEIKILIPSENEKSIAARAFRMVDQAVRTADDEKSWSELEQFTRKWLEKSAAAIDECQDLSVAPHGEDAHEDMVCGFSSMYEGFDCLLEFTSTKDENLLVSGFRAITEGEKLLSETEEAFNNVIDEPFEAYF